MGLNSAKGLNRKIKSIRLDTVGSKLIALNDEKFALLALVYELHVVAFIENERGGNLEG